MTSPASPWKARVSSYGGPITAKAISARRSRLRKYGQTPESFAATLDAQGGKCAVCLADDPGGSGDWHIDHDHRCCLAGGSCGECVRGLLCATCNSALGMVGDDADRLRRLATYLDNWNLRRG